MSLRAQVRARMATCEGLRQALYRPRDVCGGGFGRGKRRRPSTAGKGRRPATAGVAWRALGMVSKFIITTLTFSAGKPVKREGLSDGILGVEFATQPVRRV